jgi:peptidoglycan/LPS O-acetylase OafA/YrhL
VGITAVHDWKIWGMNNTAPAQRLEFLDALRGIAIIIVFFFHSVIQAFRQILLPDLFGVAGVAMFFAISGFCIHLSFSNNPDWRSFWVKRFFRIYPAYLFAVVWFALMTQTKDAWQLISHLLLIHNFSEATYFELNISFWSIAVEVQLYAMYPVLLWLTRTYGWQSTLWGVGILEFSMRVMVGCTLFFGVIPPVWVIGLPLFYWFSWTIGAAVAESYIRGEQSPLGTYSASTFVFTGVVSSMLLEKLSFPFFAIAAAILIAKLLKSDAWLRRFPTALQHLTRAGIWSYSLYLINQPLIAVATDIGHSVSVPSWLIFVLCIFPLYPLVLRASGGLFGLLERPGIAIGTSFLRKRSSVLPAIS